MSRLARSLRAYRYDQQSDSHFVAGSDSCTIPVVGKRSIDGSLFSCQSSTTRGTVLFVHESGGNRWSVAPYLQLWRAAGFDVLTCDFPDHIADAEISQPTGHPWVTRAQVDNLLAAVDYVVGKRGCTAVWLMGVSRSGLTALCAAARDHRVSAVVVDSSYLCEDLIAHYIRAQSSRHSRIGPYLMRLVPNSVLRWHARFALRRILGKCDAGYSEPRRLVQRVTQPVLIVHGQRDHWVPCDVAASLCRRIRNADLWIVEGAKHRMSIHVAQAAYEDRLRRFVDQVGPVAKTEAKVAVPKEGKQLENSVTDA